MNVSKCLRFNGGFQWKKNQTLINQIYMRIDRMISASVNLAQLEQWLDISTIFLVSSLKKYN